MPWVALIWSMIAGAMIATALIHWRGLFRQSGQHVHFAFPALTLSVAGVVIGEMLLMYARTPAEFGTILRWTHVPGFLAVIMVAVFVRAYLPGGRLWLAYAACGLRVLSLILNFTLEPNINFRIITDLRQIEMFDGEKISVAVGVASPWTAIATSSLIVLALFVADSALACWRRGGRAERRRAIIVGGSFALSIAVAAISTALIHAGVVGTVYFNGVIFLAVVAAITFELNADAARSAQLGTELVKSEAALRQSEQRLDQAAEAAALGLWEWDVVRDEFWFTNRCRTLFGFDASERIDFNRILAALHPEDRGVLQEGLTRSLTEGGSYEREYRVALPGGRIRWLIVRGRVDTDATGRPTLLRGLALDITERKDAEERFQRVVEAAPIGMLIVSSSGRIALVNARVETDFGYSRQELIGQPVEMLMADGFRARHALDSGSYFGNPAMGRMTAREVLGLRKDGSELPLEIGLSPIQGADGPAVLATLVDVSDRKRREELLRHERGFLRQVIDIVPNLIFAKDREGLFTLANQAVADLYGTTVDALLGKTDADFNVGAGEVESFRRVDLEVMDTLRERVIPEERITDAAGNDRWLQTVKRPIVSKDGKAFQVLGSATDITASKRSEQELAQLRYELAHLARVTMLSELSGSLAHELNQPLTAILSNAQAALRFLAQDKPNLDEAREILRDIVEDDKRAGDVIKGLRMLLKRGEMLREPLDIGDIARDVLRLVRSDMLNNGVGLATDFAPGLPKILGDRAQLQQVLINLVMNGCDAMAAVPAAERQLIVSIGLADGDHIALCVSDRGPGIPLEDLERVFDPFVTTKEKGLGLGLSVCRTIVAAHDGRLWATNGAGGGAIFCLALPVMARGAE